MVAAENSAFLSGIANNRSRGFLVVQAGPRTGGSQRSAAGARALVRKLVEALTVLGNYIAAANHISVSRRPMQERFGEVLEKSSDQYERAADAARRLRNLSCSG